VDMVTERLGRKKHKSFSLWLCCNRFSPVAVTDSLVFLKSVFFSDPVFLSFTPEVVQWVIFACHVEGCGFSFTNKDQK